jgi:hypothetical protein
LMVAPLNNAILLCELDPIVREFEENVHGSSLT